MEQFKYDESQLTEEQQAAIASCKAAYDAEMKRLIEQEDYRMQNYYDCVDDYSWGGPCTKANYIARDKAKVEMEERIESIVRGGFIIRTRKVNVLKDKETGETVAEGLRSGEYGPYFTVRNGEEVKYVSFAKRVSTFEKKGYLPYVRSITEKLRPNGWWSQSGDRRYETLEVISVTDELSTERCW